MSELSAPLILIFGLLAVALWQVWIHQRLETQLVIICVVAPLQLFLPQPLGLPPIVLPLALMASMQFAWQRFGRLSAAALIFAAVSTVSLLWSPSLRTGLSHSLYFLAMAGLIGCGRLLASKGSSLLPLLKAWVLASAVESVLVMWFRLKPDAEMKFLQGPVAPYLVNPSSLRELFRPGGGNNVLDAGKAGGLLLNGNAASAFIGVALMVSLYLYAMTNARKWLGFGMLAAFAVVATGSKSGLGLLIGLLPLAMLLRGRVHRQLPMALALAAIGIGAAVAVPAVVSDTPYSSSVGTRVYLWGQAINAIAAHPLSGLGFGGWDEWLGNKVSLVGSASSYPPHNLFLYTYVQMGIAGFIALLVLLARLLRTFLPLKRSEQVYLFLAVVWTIAHAMGDNTTVLNDLHTMPALACAIGYVEWRKSNEAARIGGSERFVQGERALHH
jgi:hypothetical protein